ncbi:hypothetical protein D9758_004751 [Tetrapyrgos nigripes]|uniref:1-alkyl-2-acetylglycerophosphocholine esterase n=1 Tax=Tetrapyrgos nigripes TaxID=182062 RepID=A0A8H5G617_9AGAR|nr:hypothetical protein D9758_004751 [Tetrapyrgos nigripes]
MFSLPAPDGYPVGSTTFITSVNPPVTAGSAKIKRNGRLLLDEICFTAYYPCDVPPKKAKKGPPWLSRPLSVDQRGYALFLGLRYWLSVVITWPLVYLYGQFVEIPAYVNAPLQSPPSSKKWPLVIFSHGLGGSRTAYSQICTRIAASGRIVLAIEHHDGSAHAAVANSAESGSKRAILYVNTKDASWESEITHPELDAPPPLPLRTDQLVIRRHEVYHTFETFSRFLKGEKDVEIRSVDGSEIPLSSWIPQDSGVPLVDLEHLQLAGHSFGGCTLFSILSTHPPERYEPLPVSTCLVLDPWMDPFPSPGPVPLKQMHKASDEQSALNGNGAPHDDMTGKLPRMLIINSEGFTLWTDHFERLQLAAKAFGATLLTLGRNKTSVKLMGMIATLSVQFLDGESLDTNESVQSALDQALHESHTKVRILNSVPEKIVVGKWGDGSDKHKMVGNLGDVIIHLD